jgi:hypothetical protein
MNISRAIENHPTHFSPLLLPATTLMRRDMSRFGIAILPALVALSPGSAFAAEPEPAPVPVEGVVETIDDTVHVPYAVPAISQSGSRVASFDVPPGKRLIVETIAFDVLTAQDAVASTRVSVGVFNAATRTLFFTQLPIQQVKGNALTSVLPMKLRVDGTSERTDEIKVQATSPLGGSVTVVARIFGYLVDR